jgi:Domain of unknown function (DUF222)
MFEQPATMPVSVLDAAAAPADVAAWATTAAPGAHVITPLTAVDPARLDPAGRIDLLIALERRLAWLAAAQQRVLATLDGVALDWAGKDSVDYTEEQVAAALRLSPGHAADRLTVARTLVERLPATLTLLDRGEITYLHARRLADAVAGVDDPTARKVEERVLPRAGAQTVGQFTATLRRAVIAADPRRAEQRHDDALAQRRVVFTPQPDGVSELWALLPADGAALVNTVLDALAHPKTREETRSVDHRRADCSVDVFARVLGDPALPEQHGHRPAIQVTVAASTLLGCDERPADLDGYGPITAAMARRIAADPTGTWRRLLTDPATAQLLDYGRTTYRPPTALTDHVLARDRTCVFPGCPRSARRCDLDHDQPWTTGGTTAVDNLHALCRRHPLCRRHHSAKHHAGWQHQPHPDGTHHWTAPTGHIYTTHPPDDG